MRFISLISMAALLVSSSLVSATDLEPTFELAIDLKNADYTNEDGTKGCGGFTNTDFKYCFVSSSIQTQIADINNSEDIKLASKLVLSLYDYESTDAGSLTQFLMKSVVLEQKAENAAEVKGYKIEFNIVGDNSMTAGLIIATPEERSDWEKTGSVGPGTKIEVILRTANNSSFTDGTLISYKTSYSFQPKDVDSTVSNFTWKPQADINKHNFTFKKLSDEGAGNYHVAILPANNKKFLVQGSNYLSIKPGVAVTFKKPATYPLFFGPSIEVDGNHKPKTEATEAELGILRLYIESKEEYGQLIIDNNFDLWLGKLELRLDPFVYDTLEASDEIELVKVTKVSDAQDASYQETKLYTYLHEDLNQAKAESDSSTDDATYKVTSNLDNNFAVKFIDGRKRVVLMKWKDSDEAQHSTNSFFKIFEAKATLVMSKLDVLRNTTIDTLISSLPDVITIDQKSQPNNKKNFSINRGQALFDLGLSSNAQVQVSFIPTLTWNSSKIYKNFVQNYKLVVGGQYKQVSGSVAAFYYRVKFLNESPGAVFQFAGGAARLDYLTPLEGLSAGVNLGVASKVSGKKSVVLVAGGSINYQHRFDLNPVGIWLLPSIKVNAAPALTSADKNLIVQGQANFDLGVDTSDLIKGYLIKMVVPLRGGISAMISISKDRDTETRDTETSFYGKTGFNLSVTAKENLNFTAGYLLKISKSIISHSLHFKLKLSL